MSIDLKKMGDLHLPREFEIEVIKQDYDGDGLLEQSDFSARFGTTAAGQLYEWLERSIRGKDRVAFDTGLKRFAEIRDKRIGQLFAKEARAIKDELEAQGIDIAAGFDLSDKDQLTRDKQQAREKAANIMLQPFLNAVQVEFGGRYDPAIVLGELSWVLSLGFDGMTIDDVAVQMMRHSCVWMGSCKHDHLRDTYAEIRYNEYRQPPHLAALEIEFGIDTQIGGEMISEGECKKMRDALLFIREKRPDDLSLLKILHIENGPNRGMAYAGDGRISIFGGFASPDPTLIVTDRYAEESQQCARYCPTEEYLRQKISHELAHLVAERDGPRDDGHFDVPLKYSGLVQSRLNDHEWFAEDYSIYLLTNGEKVMQKTIEGEIVPLYDERLEYFRKHYPMNK